MDETTIPSSVNDKTSYIKIMRLDEEGEGLSSWECEFLDSLMGQVDKGRCLSSKQTETLNKIMMERMDELQYDELLGGTEE